MVALKVTGDVSDEELEADATVQAAEYTFEDEGLTAGENRSPSRTSAPSPTTWSSPR